MDIKFNDKGSFILDEGALIESLQIRNEIMIEKALVVARETAKHVESKYIFSEWEIEDKGEDFVRINGEDFRSKTLAGKIKGIDRVFPYIATCGSEVSRHTEALKDVFDTYVSEKVEYLALTQVREQMMERIRNEYDSRGLSHINPGSIKDWSILEVRKIFGLLYGKPAELGLNLLDSGMIMPLRSVSGFIFLGDDEFHNCILCMIEDCPNRTAEFDEEEYRNSL